MPTKKSPEDTLTEDFELFDALAAIDTKNYKYFHNLRPEVQRKFVPYMMLMWSSSVSGDGDISDYYLRSNDLASNKYFFHEAITDHPELQWMMLCAASPGMGKQRHSWIPHLQAKKINLNEPISVKEAREYFKKIGYDADSADAYADHQRRAVKLAEICPRLSVEDLQILTQMTTDEEIEDYYRQQGN